MLTIDDVMVEPPGIGEILDPTALFSAPLPVEMEIGCGKGGFLLRRAQDLPDRNFLGVEWANKIVRYAADRMARWGVTNVRLMRTDATHLISHQMTDECLTMLHIYHPDPWPKKRHHKRRLIQSPFLAKAVDRLVPGGRIAIQTDHAEYFKQIQQVVAAERRLEVTAFEDDQAGVIDGRVRTNFEIKYLREGRAIYQIAARKSSHIP